MKWMSIPGLFLIVLAAATGRAAAQDGAGDILLAVKNHDHHEIDFVDLSDANRTCAPANISGLGGLADGQSAHATFVGGPLLLCGEQPEDCYEYDDAAGQWAAGPQRLQVRYLPYGLDLGGVHWVSAGRDGLEELDSSEEIGGDGGAFAESAALPFESYGHCAVALSDDEALVMTGT